MKEGDGEVLVGVVELPRINLSSYCGHWQVETRAAAAHSLCRKTGTAR